MALGNTFGALQPLQYNKPPASAYDFLNIMKMSSQSLRSAELNQKNLGGQLTWSHLTEYIHQQNKNYKGFKDVAPVLFDGFIQFLSANESEFSKLAKIYGV